jgi:A-kinase anchor protein 10
MEKNCLCYFIQFLETVNAINLIKFWLDVENFRTAAELCREPATKSINGSSPRSNKLDTLSNSDLMVAKRRHNPTQSVSSEGYDSLSYVSTNDFDTLSTNSFSENNLDDVGEEDALDGKSNDTVDGTSTNSSNPEQSETHQLSLTDDEKYQLSEKKRSHAQTNDTKPPKNGISNVQAMIMADAIKIYKKYLIANSPYHIHDIPVCVLSTISLSLCGDSDTTILPLNIFQEAQTYILELLEKEYLNAFLDSTMYCKFTIDVLTSDNLTISDILYCESALFYFMEFLEQDHQNHYLEFWLSATNFRRQIEMASDEAPIDRQQVQNDALVLYEKYFSLQATTTTLNMSNAVRSRVEENICQETGPTAGCFDLPIGVIEYYLERKYLKEFLKSQLFCKYLTEMFNRIQEHKTDAAATPSAVEATTKKSRHRKTFSDCTADKAKPAKNSFMSCQNTLLAMESTNRAAHLRTRGLPGADNLQINFQMMTNPDLLWKRHSTGGNGQLSFGRVNALGRYERDFDMELVEEKGTLASGGDLLKKAVKKLVHLPENEVQEEMAWQVAEMIIKDITDVTMGGGHSGGGHGKGRGDVGT